MDRLSFAVDAVTDIPDDLIAAVVTYLEMTAPPAGAPAPAPQGAALSRLCGADCERYLTIYRTIGERWLWFSRLAWPRERLEALLDDPGVAAYAVTRAGADVGLLELDAREGAETELAFLGLVETEIGGGMGRWLMAEATARAFARPIRRFFVHTCTFDHPRALNFYRRAGFRPYRRAIELARDPRLTGLLSCEAAAHSPILTRG